MPLPLLAGLGAKLLLGGSKIKTAAAKVPPKVWLIIALVIALGIGSCVAKNKHEAAVKTFGEEQFAAGKASRDAEIKSLQRRLAAKTNPIVQEEKVKHEQEDRRVSAAADDLRVRGPGKAICPRPPSLSGSPGEHRGTTDPGNAPLAEVPSLGGEYIALPHADTVSFGESHDKLRNEVVSWRSWYKRLKAEWDKYAAAAEGTPNAP